MTARKIGMLGPDRRMSVSERLGRSDYSYHFVLRYFAEALADDYDIEVLMGESELGNIDRTDLVFLPPHRLPREANVSDFLVFAWEYDTIPTDAWNDEERNDWRIPLSQVGGTIVHSEFARRSVAKAMPAGYPILSAPAPVWDEYVSLASQPKPEQWRLTFTGWLLDSRQAGLDQNWELPPISFEPAPQEVELEGIVYTLLANPDDGRKNWVDALSSFTMAFRENPEATLLVKLIHHNPHRAGNMVMDWIYRTAPYQCRVVVIFGYLDDQQYQRMILGSSYVVNSSHGEGQCLPLMEFMSAGVPAIAPDHTAMAEYVSSENAFVVETFTRWVHWPHDPRLLLRCMQHEINWQSMHDAYLTSFDTIRQQPGMYRAMGVAASESLREFASQAVVISALERFLADPTSSSASDSDG